MLPFLDLAARHAEAAADVERRVLEVLRSGHYVGGPVVAEAEAVAARWMGRSGAVGLSNGTDALMLALQAVGVRPGDEVVVPALTFFATAGAVAAIGAVPRVVDVREDGLMDPALAAGAVTERTAAVVPVHLFGSHAERPSVPVPVVDDAAQAVGADPPCSDGVLSAVSTYPTKLWGGAGDGGFVVGDDPALLDAVRRLGHHGQVGAHLHQTVGGAPGRNARLDALQAAVLLGHAPMLPQRIAHRRQLVAAYEALLPPRVRPLVRTPGATASPFVVRVGRREAVQQALHDAGIGASIYYPRSLTQQPALAGPHAPTPVADALAAEVLALPVHSGMGTADVERVVAVLSEVA